MNEKIIISVFLFSLFLSGCRTTVLYNGNTDADVRSDLSELQTEQSDSAETAATITERSGELAEGIREAAGTAESGEKNNRELESLIKTIRGQKLTERSGENEAGPGPGEPE